MALSTTITATAAAFVAGAAFAVPAAQANQLCYSAGVSGTITGTHNTPRLCQTTGLPILCTTPETGLGDTIGVHAEACVPD
jgi:hypothetical protein